MTPLSEYLYRYWIYAWDKYYPCGENVIGRYTDSNEAISIAETKSDLYDYVSVIDALPMLERGDSFGACVKLYEYNNQLYKTK